MCWPGTNKDEKLFVKILKISLCVFNLSKLMNKYLLIMDQPLKNKYFVSLETVKNEVRMKSVEPQHQN